MDSGAPSNTPPALGHARARAPVYMPKQDGRHTDAYFYRLLRQKMADRDVQLKEFVPGDYTSHAALPAYEPPSEVVLDAPNNRQAVEKVAELLGGDTNLAGVAMKLNLGESAEASPVPQPPLEEEVVGVGVATEVSQIMDGAEGAEPPAEAEAAAEAPANEEVQEPQEAEAADMATNGAEGAAASVGIKRASEHSTRASEHALLEPESAPAADMLPTAPEAAVASEANEAPPTEVEATASHPPPEKRTESASDAPAAEVPVKSASAHPTPEPSQEFPAPFVDKAKGHLSKVVALVECPVLAEGKVQAAALNPALHQMLTSQGSLAHARRKGQLGLVSDLLTDTSSAPSPRANKQKSYSRPTSRANGKGPPSSWMKQLVSSPKSKLEKDPVRLRVVREASVVRTPSPNQFQQDLVNAAEWQLPMMQRRSVLGAPT